jgi:integrase/recombinase XerD
MTRRKSTTISEAAPNRCMPFAEWPDSDRIAWSAALRPGTPFAPGGIAARWAASTRTITINGYGRWLTWLQRYGFLDPSIPLGARATEERLIAYMASLQAEVGDFTVQARIQQLGDALRAMAPDGEWRWILRAASRLRSEAIQVKDKRARLVMPDRLVDLGIRLMAEAGSAPGRSEIQRAVTFRDGLVIALLAYRPVRIRTLTAIAVGRQLVAHNGGWQMVFGPEDIKTKHAFECSFPRELASHLEIYLSVHRPILLTCGGRRPPTSTKALWVSQNGTAMVIAAIAYWIRRNTKEAFGAALGPHMFRDAAATAIAIYAPEDVLIIKVILGHATIQTAEKYYNLAGSLEASRRHHEIIAELRAPGRELRNCSHFGSAPEA